jgi:hypothetical protein
MHKYRELHPRKIALEEKISEIQVNVPETPQSVSAPEPNVHPITGEPDQGQQDAVLLPHEGENIT